MTGRKGNCEFDSPRLLMLSTGKSRGIRIISTLCFQWCQSLSILLYLPTNCENIIRLIPTGTAQIRHGFKLHDLIAASRKLKLNVVNVGDLVSFVRPGKSVSFTHDTFFSNQKTYLSW